MTRPADIYFRFLQLRDALRGLPALPALDPLEQRMIEFIAGAVTAGERLSVRDLMGKGELASPATLHSRLQSLRDKGWVLLEDTEDTRRKQLALTPAAMRHFDRLAECFAKAATDAK